MKRGYGSEDSSFGMGMEKEESGVQQKSEIVRHDSVEVHSMAKSEEEVGAPVGEGRGFVVRCQGGL